MYDERNIKRGHIMSKINPTIRVRKSDNTLPVMIVELYLLFPYKKGYDELFGFRDLETPELEKHFNCFRDDIEDVVEVYLLEK